ncbi:MAG: hypothetical protein ACKVTZ_22880 [Bacteroidia bacterium]
MKYFFFCILSLIFTCLPAQVSGYLGKRFLVEIQPQVATHNWGYGKIVFKGKTTFMITPGIHVEYATGRKGAVCLDYHFASHKATFAIPTQYDVNSSYYIASPEALRVSFQHIGLSYRFYFVRSNSWALAPVGPYLALGLCRSFGIKTGELPETTLANYTLPTGKNRNYLSLLFGSRSVLWHKVTLDYSVGLNISTLKPSFINFRDYEEFDEYKDEEDLLEYNTSAVNEKVRMANFFVAKVGVGVLLF